MTKRPTADTLLESTLHIEPIEQHSAALAQWLDWLTDVIDELDYEQQDYDAQLLTEVARLNTRISNAANHAIRLQKVGF